MATIVEVKEECQSIERELNELAQKSIMKFERRYGVRLRISFSGSIDEPFEVWFEG